MYSFEASYVTAAFKHSFCNFQYMCCKSNHLTSGASVPWQAVRISELEIPNFLAVGLI